MKFSAFASRALATSAIALMATVGTVSAANAHDRLVSTTPENGAELKIAPEAITLTFSAQLQEIADSTAAALLRDGKQVDIDTELDGDTVTITPDEDLANGDYTVDVRVVSSDGHPVEDTIEFTVAEPEAEASSTASGEPEETATIQGQDSASETPADDASQSPAHQQDEHSNNSTLIIGIIIGVVVLGAVVGVLMKMTRKNK